MNSIGKIGSLALANGRECAGRTSDRIVPGNNGKITPRDHPMLQTNDQSNEVKKTQHSYKEPRIDQRMYQADIPLLQGRASNRAVTRGSSSPRAAPPDLRPGQLSATENCVWSPNVVGDRQAVDAFLLFGRNLLEQSMGETGGYDSDSFNWRTGANSVIPNESDEIALEFLYKHAGDVQRAEFHVATQVSSGAGARSLEVTEARRGPPQQLSSWQSAYSKRLDALGFFDSSEVGSYAYPTDLVRKNIEASSDEDDANWDPEQEGDGCDEVDDDEADESGQADDDIAETVAPFIPQDLERSRRGADRAAFKSRWNAVQERVRDIRHARRPSPKPTLEECVAILDEAASLPPPEQAPGEDFVDQALQAVTVIWEMTTRAREWIASVSDVLNPGSDPRRVDGTRAVGITDLQRLLSEANTLPVSVAEVDEVARIIQAAIQWQRKVDEMLSNLQAPARARSGRGSNCIQLSLLRDVLEEADLIPVRLEQRAELQDRVQGTTALAARIADAFPSGRRVKTRPSLATAQNLMDEVKSSGLDFPESARLKKNLGAVNDWVSKAKAALAGSVALRELEKLLTEADKLAVDPGPKQPELQAKMNKALVWLEKVRKAVPKQRFTRRNTPDAEAEKVDLSHVKGLLSASSTTGVEMDMKEFSHTNDLIENAEEWMARVREVLESGEPATLHGLEALLTEAESIPVTMDEQQLLTVGIKARQWRLRVDSTLAGGKAKLQELQDLATKGATLRAGFPKDAKSHPVYGVLDDSQLQALLKRGKTWTNKARQCLQTMQAGRPMASSLLLNLAEESKAIKLNLSPEANSLREAVSELRQWRDDHHHILRALGLTKGDMSGDGRSSKVKKGITGDTKSLEARASGAGNGIAVTPMDIDDDEENDERQSDTQGESRGTAEPKEDVSKVTLQNLSACIHAAERITIGRSMKEVRDMRVLVASVNEWIDQCQSLCPRRQSKRRVQPSNKPTFDGLQDLITEGLASPVSVTDEVDRIRRHIAEALSWQLNAKSVLTEVCSSFAEQTKERNDMWRKDEEKTRLRELSKRHGLNGKGKESSSFAMAATTSTAKPIQTPHASKDEAESKLEKADEEGAILKKTSASVDTVEGSESESDDDGTDREDELDEAEETNEESIQQLLTTARDISVFMPEEMVTERVQRIIQWARSVRESASFAGEGLQLSQAKDIINVSPDVLDLTAGNKLEVEALTPSITTSLRLVIDCYQGKVEEIQRSLKKAENWTVQAKELMGRDSIRMEEIEMMLKTAEDVGVENEDISKKIRAELGRCRAWRVKADAALNGAAKLSVNALKKLIAEGEKIKTSGTKLKELKHHMKLATKWLQRLKRTGIEKGTASINELKAMIPDAVEIRVDLSEDIRVLKQATCSYCICSRPGEDLGFLVECKNCAEGYHGVCMGISPDEASALNCSEEGFTCIRCRISSLFTSAESAMLTAMKKWMPSTCFAEQAGFDEAPLADESGVPGRDRWQASQNFAALAGVVRDAMNLPRKKIRTSLGVLSEVDNNINALTTLPWGKNASGEEQHQHARGMLCSLRVLLWCTMAQWAVRKPPSVILLYDLVSQGQQLTQVDHDLLKTLGTMARRASLWEASVRDAFRGPAGNVDSLIDVGTLRKLLEDAKRIPVLLSLESKVAAALDDGGNRYCLCRGPNDGTFMVECDECEQWFHGECVNLKEAEGKSLNNFECPGCAKKKGGQYTYGVIDLEALRQQGVTPTPILEGPAQGEEDAGGSEVSSNTCTWPPPDAEYFFGTLDLTQLAGSDPGPSPVPEPEPQPSGIMHAASEAYRFQEMPRMPRTAPQAPVVEPETPPHLAPPQFAAQQYLPTAAVSPTGPAPYGGLGGYYQHYPPHPQRAANVDPYHSHPNDPFGPPMTAPPQSHPPDPYGFPMARPVVDAAPVVGEGARKRAVEAAAVAAAAANAKRVRTDDAVPVADTQARAE